MSDRPKIEIHQQTAFDDDGQLEVTESSVEISLEDFGADVDHRERDSRIDRPEAAEFGVDDRPEATRSLESNQSNLFAETAEDQQTLTGDDAAMQCLSASSYLRPIRNLPFGQDVELGIVTECIASKQAEFTVA